MEESISNWTFDELAEGHEQSFVASVSERAIDDFAKLSGDVSTLHMDSAFARSRGFERGRVAHGALLGALVSRLIGTKLPGGNAVIHQVQMTYHNPCYAGDRVTISGRIDRKIPSVRAILVSVRITVSEDGTEPKLLATGKVQVGFTSELARTEIQN